MQIISLKMTTPNRQKLLGQFFSGRKIANSLFDLLGKPCNKTVIDPMCGRGDLLMPFINDNTVNGIELDPVAFSMAQENMPNAISLVNSNAFELSHYSFETFEGYDVVITNPPFVRRENYTIAQEQVEGTLPISCVISNLEDLTKNIQTLTLTQKQEVIGALKKVSGLADISLLSWVLCMLITKVEGHFALVVPNTLLAREYSIDVLSLFKSLFEIDYIINDVNSVWFDGIAQIQTSLIVAKRTNYISKSHDIRIVDLYKEAVGRNSIASFTSKRQTLKGFVNKGKSIEGVCEIRKVKQLEYASQNMAIQASSKLHSVIQKEDVVYKTFDDFGIICGQGFRSGANTFFILENEEDVCVSKILQTKIKRHKNFVKSIIQNQRSLGGNYVIDSDKETSSLLVIPRGYATTEDVVFITKECYCIMSPVPRDIQEYINIAAKEKVGKTLIPELSSVKTNVRNKDGIIAFWYNLPSFTKRHTAPVFIPRVNGKEVIARYNPKQYVVDANFITFWQNDDVKSPLLDNHALIAILNSTWFSILCEESGIVMGGGALKLDSIQIQKFPIPSFSVKDLNILSKYGKALINTPISSSNTIIDSIDRMFAKFLCDDNLIEETVIELNKIKTSYLQKRSK